MILLPNYVDFLIEHNLNQEQYLLLHLLYYREFNLIKKYKEKFPKNTNQLLSKEHIEDLLNRKYLIKVKNKGYVLGTKFTDIFVTPELAVDEIYEVYPAFIKSDLGVDIPLTSMDKNIFKNIYIAKIFGNVKEHKEIIQDIIFAKENNLIKIGINKFLTSEQWKSFRKQRLTLPSTRPTLDTDNF